MKKRASLFWLSPLAAILAASLSAGFLRAVNDDDHSVLVVNHAAVNWESIPPEPDPSPLSVAAYAN